MDYQYVTGEIPTAIRAKIVGDSYRVGDIIADSLTSLCVRLLAGSFDPEASVECYRAGRADWDVRAKSIRAAAAELARRAGQGGRSPPAEKRTLGVSRRLTGASEKPSSNLFKPRALVWEGMRLRLRSSKRFLAVVKPDAGYPNLYRIHLAPDHLSDLLNLTRAKEAAVALALTMLNREVATKQARNAHRPKAVERIS
jgi:hypothetical protein